MEKIHSFALAMRVISQEKDFVYVRDTYWPNFKRTTTVSNNKKWILWYYFIVKHYEDSGYHLTYKMINICIT